jgi:hypothetical protein
LSTRGNPYRKASLAINLASSVVSEDTDTEESVAPVVSRLPEPELQDAKHRAVATAIKRGRFLVFIQGEFFELN